MLINMTAGVVILVGSCLHSVSHLIYLMIYSYGESVTSFTKSKLMITYNVVITAADFAFFIMMILLIHVFKQHSSNKTLAETRETLSL